MQDKYKYTERIKMAEFLKQELIWTRKPERVFMDETKVEIITECSTDGVNWKLQNVNGKHINKKRMLIWKENYLSRL